MKLLLIRYGQPKAEAISPGLSGPGIKTTDISPDAIVRAPRSREVEEEIEKDVPRPSMDARAWVFFLLLQRDSRTQ